eukprot:scaffold394651_cov13-Prasinocladus_malaysianus.AAC.1
MVHGKLERMTQPKLETQEADGMVALSVTPALLRAPVWQALAAVQTLPNHEQALASIGSKLVPLSIPMVPEGLPQSWVLTLTKVTHSPINPELDVAPLSPIGGTKMTHFV